MARSAVYAVRDGHDGPGSVVAAARGGTGRSRAGCIVAVVPALDGIRVIDLSRIVAGPLATQILSDYGAEVVKIERPEGGDDSRQWAPPVASDGEASYFFAVNRGKRSVTLDLKHPRGKALLVDLVRIGDVLVENFKPGTMDRMGLGYADIAAVYPRAIYVSISGFGNTVETPYRDWPAYASIVEAMSGIYDYRHPEAPPVTIPVGALGDISSALFGVIGIMAALRHRDRTGEGQYVDIAMFDAMVAMTDIVTNFWSLGVRPEPEKGLQVICEGFRASDGYVVAQVVREPQFWNLGDLVGRPEWRDDPRFATRAGWAAALESEIRPAVDAWASKRTKLEAARELTAAGVVAGPSNHASDVIADPHVAARHMLVEMERTDGGAEPVLVPGNPVKLSKVSEGPETRVPWVGEHTTEVLTAELGLSEAELAGLRERGVIA